jgi:hypothetical protein
MRSSRSRSRPPMGLRLRADLSSPIIGGARRGLPAGRLGSSRPIDRRGIGGTGSARKRERERRDFFFLLFSFRVSFPFRRV